MLDADRPGVLGLRASPASVVFVASLWSKLDNDCENIQSSWKTIHDFSGKIYDFSGKIYAFSGKIYAFSGKIYDFSGKIYDFSGKIYDFSGKIYDFSGDSLRGKTILVYVCVTGIKVAGKYGPSGPCGSATINLSILPRK